MLLNFKYGEYNIMLDKYSSLFEAADAQSTDETDGNVLCFFHGRVVIPALHLSFREGDWYEKADYDDMEFIGNENDEDEWEYQAQVFAVYEESVRDVNLYSSFYDETAFNYFLKAECEKAGLSFADRKELDCYIDTSEFIDDETAKKLYPNLA